jgi:hypothetical protein
MVSRWQIGQARRPCLHAPDGAPGALGVVAGAGAERGVQAAKAWAMRASMSRSLWTYRAATAFFWPDARVIRLVAAQLR